jgi:hypothetical protein
MTFALKDFEHLKKHFNDCVAFVLKRDGKEKISDLPSRRRDELQFLTSVIAELETHKITTESVNTLYGAMLVTNQDIINRMKSGESTSKVLDRLNIAMDIKDSSKPSNDQYATFYKSLNRFLNLIYVENDSRKGFKKEHALQTVPAPKLVDFAKIGFQLEEAAQNQISTTLTVDGKSNTDGSWYKAAKLVPESIVAPFTSFAALKEALHQLIIAETADKNTADLTTLDPSRAIQLQFLESLANSLSGPKASGIKETEKTAILAGAMYIVRGQIAQEYGYAPLSHTDIVATLLRNGSVVHTELTKVLNAKTTCVEDTEVLINAANQYIRHMTVEKVDAKEAIRAKHLFTDIKDFSIVSILELAQNMIRSCRDMAIDFCLGELNKEIKAQEALQPKAPTTSYASTIYSWWKKAPQQPTAEEDLEEQHAATVDSGPSSS